MANKANEVFYDKLTRKELQSMCKIYGLPANKSHLELAKSLIAYSEVLLIKHTMVTYLLWLISKVYMYFLIIFSFKYIIGVLVS